MNTISVEELEKIDSSKITIVDVRPADQYSRGSFPGAVNIPLDEFEERMESVDREKMVYVLCHTGDRSRDCVEKLSPATTAAPEIAPHVPAIVPRPAPNPCVIFLSVSSSIDASLQKEQATACAQL